MGKTTVKLNVDGPSATITFATDGGLNVLSSDVLRALEIAVQRVADARDVRITVVRAEGKVFLAGADIREMAGLGAAQARDYGALGQGVFNDLAALPSITVASINGAALGGGLELALACDFRIAVKSAKVGMPETSLGLIPGWGGIGRLTRLIGPSRAKRMFLSAEPISCEVGQAIGLINEIVNSAEDLGPRVAAFCRSLRRAAPTAVRLAKQAFRDADDVTAFAECFETRDAREGIAAFLDKRPAPWMAE